MSSSQCKDNTSMTDKQTPVCLPACMCICFVSFQRHLPCRPGQTPNPWLHLLLLHPLSQHSPHFLLLLLPRYTRTGTAFPVFSLNRPRNPPSYKGLSCLLRVLALPDQLCLLLLSPLLLRMWCLLPILQYQLLHLHLWPLIFPPGQHHTLHRTS